MNARNLKKEERGRQEQLGKAALVALVFLGLAAAIVVVACAPRQASPGGEDGGGETDAALSMPAWSLASDCLGCHSAEADSAADASTLYGFHASVGSDQACTTCHNEEEILVKVHENNSADGSSAKKLKKTQVSSEQCQSCHDLDEIAAITADTTVLTDVNGKVVNPHQLPQSSDHETINCSDCHKMHSDKTLLSETAMETCVICHHERAFECGTCH